MFSTMSLVTSIKDYIEVVHKLIETDPNLKITTYYDFGSIVTYTLLSGKDILNSFFSFQWFQSFWSIPTLIPDIASAMISEISIFDGSFQNAQTILESPISYGNHNFLIYCSEKFMIGLLNSIFLCLPTSLAHIITLRRFVMQGLEAGFISGLGTIAGNLVWIGSIVFGLRFVVIPWLSLDLFRYFLGFVLIVKYMWDSYTERRMVLENLSKYKIFFLTFLLSFTEQTTIYPFVSNLSLGSDSTLLESFPTENFYEFGFVHFSYLLGIFIGSISLLQFTCWFWENPAFQIYMWFISSFKTTTSVYSKFVNLSFLYLTMICAISNIAYFGLDYTLTNPLGFVHEDRLLDQKALLETAFLNTKASDRNTRRNRGRHGRRERWKRRVRRYRTFDASLYDQGTYDFLTLEDLNYGFDRFWLRRKIRNHRVRFRFFPGPWMRSFKKQLSRPRLESFMGPRVEFFRILFEQAYHPEFHEFSKKKNILNTNKKSQNQLSFPIFGDQKKTKKQNSNEINSQTNYSIYWNPNGNKKERLLKENSTLRKFLRKVNNRIQIAKIQNRIQNPQNLEISLENSEFLTQPIFSKDWKSFSFIEDTKFKEKNSLENFNNAKSPFFKKYEENLLFQRFYNKILSSPNSFNKEKNNFSSESNTFQISKKESFFPSGISENNFSKHLSKKDRFLERYKTFLYTPTENNQILSSKNGKKAENISNVQTESQYRPMTLLHPLKFYFQKEQALKRKFQFYGVKLFRNFHVENNAPYFRVMMKRFFYYYKPTLRWERTLRVATMRKARRKSSRIPRKFNIQKSSQILANTNNFTNSSAYAISSNKQLVDQQSIDQSYITKPSHFYSLVEKRASRYRYQIYKDVLQHWYYSPLNRFLLKLDVDSFIRRQPNSYFLTKTDEKFLHFKRQLLSEYYETLRWYTYMQHYSTMKSQIGGTKSLSSRAYNQQFMGTFKKIRHLFNITPSFHDQNVLKFDQPLYNEYKNNQTNPIFQDSILHEELLADDFFVFSPSQNNQNSFSTSPAENLQFNQKSSGFTNENSMVANNEFSKNVSNFDRLAERLSFDSFPEDLTNQSAKILREYLSIATPIRQNYIQTLLNEKNYWELTKFLFRGQKTRGTNPITNETDFLNQEKNYLLNSKSETNDLDIQKFKEEMWVALLLKCQKKLYDQESLKNYVTLKKEKYENQKQKHEKYLKNRLERMKKSLVFTEANQSSKNFSFDTLGGYTSSIQKAMKESIFWQKNSFSGNDSSFQTVQNFFRKKNFLQKTNIRNNRSNIYSFSPNSEKDSIIVQSSFQDQIINPQKMKNVLFTNTLKNSVQNKALEILSAENVLSKSLNSKDEQTIFSKFKPFHSMKNSLWNTLRFKKFFSSTSIESKIYSDQQEKASFLNKITKFFSPFSFLSKIAPVTDYGMKETSNKGLDFWKKRENALSKRRKIRKTLKRLRIQNSAAEKILFENRDFSSQTGTISGNIEKKSLFSERNSTKPSRQKSDLLSTNQATNINPTKQDTHKNSWKNYYSYEPVDSFSSSVNKSTKFDEKGEQRKSFFEKIISFPIDTVKNGQKYFEKKFIRKRSRLRRYSSFKGRGPIKKRTLREKLKRQFKSLKKYGTTQEKTNSSQIQIERENKKLELIQLITGRSSAAYSESIDKQGQQLAGTNLPRQSSSFVKRDQKQRRTRQIKHRAWKKKKQNFAQKRRKLRKRRRSAVSKVRVFNKKLQRIISKKEIQTWWWQTFFPNFQAITEKNWQFQKNMQIRKQFYELSEKEILERDQTQNGNNQILQIGDKDYKPLAIPEALRIRDQLVQKELLRFIPKQTNFSTMVASTENQNKESSTIANSAKQSLQLGDFKKKSVLEKFTENVSTRTETNFEPFSSSKTKDFSILNSSQNGKFFVGTNPIPFYAGWDESLRKFVITNRLLSRKGCFSYSQKGMQTFFGNKDSFANSKSLNQNLPNVDGNRNKIFDEMKNNSFVEFSKAPLQGMNAATTLYWQIPFTTYDPDQFFSLGMDGFSPLGWRNFSFKHSKQTTKPILVKNFFSWDGENIRRQNNTSNLSKNLFIKFLENTQKTKLFSSNLWSNTQNNLSLNEFEKRNGIGFSTNSKTRNFSKTEIDKNFEYRRILKKQKRIKKHPRPPVWFPSGALAQQVLPVHYIYVFYKRSRLPRDRYIRRRLRSTFLKETSLQNGQAAALSWAPPTAEPKKATPVKITDFTLRKRVKPRRKYHRKRFVLESNVLVLRRRKFRSFVDENEMNRPSSKIFQSSSKQEKRNIQSKQRRKITDSKQTTENLRLRQLRRRVQRQVFRPIWRYKPRSGGLVWPGDYLRLELVKAPFLNSGTPSVENTEMTIPQTKESSTRKIRKKKRRTIQEWQIQPKKYLLEKHNMKVLKKRFEKSMQTLKV
uniref:hypothetical chloroplast RF1 n=1 Tax=Coelastrella saipanensis TaxID=152631 RepID=UPI0010C4BF86|nr:hypothetical chloroplast RF1 [Coelastrella saipanensis]AVV61621.1 hypothetical chloroplast RF1 [Coelastrella saipanensis]